MELKTKYLLASCISGAISSTMFIGNLFFKAEFGILPFVFLLLQVIFLVLMISAKENWEQSELHKNRRKMGHPQFNRKEIVDKILERTKDSSKLSELASLTDVQLYQLYLNN